MTRRADSRTSLLAKAAEVPSLGVKPDKDHVADPTAFTDETPVLTSQLVYGNEASIMVATRQGGYHSAPHYHDSEQLNYVADGELWFFVGERGYLAQKGDFFRVPRGALHWAWNRSDKPVTLFEVHTPRLVRPGETDEAVGLFAEDETPAPVGQCENLFAEVEHARRVEAALFGSEDGGGRVARGAP